MSSRTQVTERPITGLSSTASRDARQHVLTVKKWEIEFPTGCNGRVATSSGFITPIEDNTANSDFFIVYDDGTLSFSSPFPKYVREAAAKLVKLAREGVQV